MLGTGLRLPSRFAAFLNGLAIHADDFDDTQLATLPDRVYGLLTHPTAPVLPAVVALAESHGRSGAQALIAYLVGTETESKIAEAIDRRHYDAGFHSTATAGAIGAWRRVGADARARGRRHGRHAGRRGVVRRRSSRELRHHDQAVPRGSRSGERCVLAAQLVARGFTATHSVLEARRGYFSAAGGGYDAATMEQLGSTWTFDTPACRSSRTPRAR